ncbi:MAG: hypothetical protein QM756_36205 [Polyangiaceae bacterium]
MPNCDSPYLEWHHFNPPWSVRNHHEPAGMIALCSTHHRKADAGAFTADQLREFKSANRSKFVQGRFDWLRRKLLAVVGGNFYYETYQVLDFHGLDAVSFNRDGNGHVMLSAKLHRPQGPSLEIESNDWISHGGLEDLECPPSGKLLHAKYPNGDRLKVEFLEVHSAERLEQSFDFVPRWMWQNALEFPLTAVSIEYEVPARGVILSATNSTFGGVSIRGSFFQHVFTAISI